MRDVKRNQRKLKSIPKRFGFGDKTCESLGKVLLPLATPEGIKPIHVEFEIVQTDIPHLLGMDVLDREELVADTVLNRLHIAKHSTLMAAASCTLTIGFFLSSDLIADMLMS